MMSYFQNGDCDVISHRKVLPSAECTCICSSLIWLPTNSSCSIVVHCQVSTWMGDRLLAGKAILVCDQSPRSTQPSIPQG